MRTIRIAVPDTAKAGEIITLKALIRHPMESGFRRNNRGEPIPRNIITAFECRYNDEIVFEADFFPSVSADPFLTFHTLARESGTLVFQWTDQDGETWSETAEIEVI